MKKKMKQLDQISAKRNELPPSSQNNARKIFMSDFNHAKGDKGREYLFAQKWGLDVDYDPWFDERSDRSTEEITNEEFS